MSFMRNMDKEKYYLLSENCAFLFRISISDWRLMVIRVEWAAAWKKCGRCG